MWCTEQTTVTSVFCYRQPNRDQPSDAGMFRTAWIIYYIFAVVVLSFSSFFPPSPHRQSNIRFWCASMVFTMTTNKVTISFCWAEMNNTGWSKVKVSFFNLINDWSKLQTARKNNVFLWLSLSLCVFRLFDTAGFYTHIRNGSELAFGGLTAHSIDSLNIQQIIWFIFYRFREWAEGWWLHENGIRRKKPNIQIEIEKSCLVMVRSPRLFDSEDDDNSFSHFSTVFMPPSSVLSSTIS